MKRCLTWLAGSWVIHGTNPDGDTLRFVPTDPFNTQRIFPRLRWHRHNGISVRLYGIDAPETHYRCRHQPMARQPYPWGERATQCLLDYLGFPKRSHTRNGRLIDDSPYACRGALALMAVDRYGRGVGLAFRGQGDHPDHPLTLSPAWWLTSANLAMLRAGLAWPLLQGHFPEIWVPAMLAAIDEARSAQRGCWAADCTHSGFPVGPEAWSALQSTHLIWPFLFRRLAQAYAKLSKDSTLPLLTQLDRQSGRVTLRSSNCHVSFIDLLQIEQGRLRLLAPPEEILLPVP